MRATSAMVSQVWLEADLLSAMESSRILTPPSTQGRSSQLARSPSHHSDKSRRPHGKNSVQTRQETLEKLKLPLDLDLQLKLVDFFVLHEGLFYKCASLDVFCDLVAAKFTSRNQLSLTGAILKTWIEAICQKRQDCLLGGVIPRRNEETEALDAAIDSWLEILGRKRVDQLSSELIRANLLAFGPDESSEDFLFTKECRDRIRANAENIKMATSDKGMANRNTSVRMVQMVENMDLNPRLEPSQLRPEEFYGPRPGRLREDLSPSLGARSSRPGTASSTPASRNVDTNRDGRNTTGKMQTFRASQQDEGLTATSEDEDNDLSLINPSNRHTASQSSSAKSQRSTRVSRSAERVTPHQTFDYEFPSPSIPESEDIPRSGPCSALSLSRADMASQRASGSIGQTRGSVLDPPRSRSRLLGIKKQYVNPGARTQTGERSRPAKGKGVATTTTRLSDSGSKPNSRQTTVATKSGSPLSRRSMWDKGKETESETKPKSPRSSNSSISSDSDSSDSSTSSGSSSSSTTARGSVVNNKKKITRELAASIDTPPPAPHRQQQNPRRESLTSELSSSSSSSQEVVGTRRLRKRRRSASTRAPNDRSSSPSRRFRDDSRSVQQQQHEKHRLEGGRTTMSEFPPAAPQGPNMSDIADQSPTITTTTTTASSSSSQPPPNQHADPTPPPPPPLRNQLNQPDNPNQFPNPTMIDLTNDIDIDIKSEPSSPSPSSSSGNKKKKEKEKEKEATFNITHSRLSDIVSTIVARQLADLETRAGERFDEISKRLRG
ncbi:hypothetical protein F4778DRAFT_231056 [Xylariomycetidae sp. FL2044]|nr:hypothetical protein F4778DRAFT_231056 [Xylariomycetidae sp. FL2044]